MSGPGPTETRMRRFVSIGPALAVITAVCVALFAAPSTIRQIQVARVAATISLAQNTLAQGGELDSLNREISAIADAVLPGVVHIEINRQSSRFFGSVSSGTGWFYDDLGTIVTNYHVVGGAGVIRVELHDGRVETAELIGSDPQTDIAVLRIDPGPGVFALDRASGAR